MARKKTAAQLNREIGQVLSGSKPPTAPRRKKTGGGPSEKTKTIGGYKVSILDHKTLGAARFAAYYDLLPPTVVGRGETEAEAIADLQRAADHYGKRRQAEIEREDWAHHEAEKEAALERGDY